MKPDSPDIINDFGLVEPNTDNFVLVEHDTENSPTFIDDFKLLKLNIDESLNDFREPEILDDLGRSSSSLKFLMIQGIESQKSNVIYIESRDFHRHRIPSMIEG